MFFVLLIALIIALGWAATGAIFGSRELAFTGVLLLIVIVVLFVVT
jgi:hypothetical protein